MPTGVYDRHLRRTPAMKRRDRRVRAVWAALSDERPQPAIRDLATRLGVSASQIAGDIDKLVAAGYVERMPGVFRGYRIVVPLLTGAKRI